MPTPGKAGAKGQLVLSLWEFILSPNNTDAEKKNHTSLLINYEFKASEFLFVEWKKLNLANLKALENISGYQGLRGQYYRGKVYGKVSLRQLLFS